MGIWGGYYGTRTRTHTRSILWVITHTHARIQNAGFYPIRYEYFLWVGTEHVSNCHPYISQKSIYI